MTIAGRTYRQLIDEVLEYQFAPGKYETLTKRWLNDAQRKAVIQSEFRVQQTIKNYETSVGDTTYAIPSDFSRLIDLFETDSHEKLWQLDLREFDQLYEVTGRPMAYAVAGNEITVYPTPDNVYPLELRYWRLPQDMEKDEDEPEIPAQYHEVLIAYAMNKCYLRENDYGAANQWKAEWEAGVMKMRGEAQNDVEDGPRQVGGIWGAPGLSRLPGYWR